MYKPQTFITLGPFIDRETSITAMAVDPHGLFAYWYIDPLRQTQLEEHFQMSWNSMQVYLCLYDVTTGVFNGWNRKPVRQHEINPQLTRWYFRELVSYRNYIVDVAIQAKELFTVARSRRISLPPSKAAESEKDAVSVPLQDTEKYPLQRYSLFDGYHLAEVTETNNKRSDNR